MPFLHENLLRQIFKDKSCPGKYLYIGSAKSRLLQRQLWQLKSKSGPGSLSSVAAAIVVVVKRMKTHTGGKSLKNLLHAQMFLLLFFHPSLV